MIDLLTLVSFYDTMKSTKNPPVRKGILMFPAAFDYVKAYQKKSGFFLYEAGDSHGRYMLKCAPFKDRAAVSALQDEYACLSALSHPSIPSYHGIMDHFSPEDGSDFTAVCMDYCRGTSLYRLAASLSPACLAGILHRTGQILDYLLQEGILYTDLHPSNILVRNEGGNNPEITLLDYTYCYYFKRNPRPSYGLRFSYRATPSLKGQQLLIQELALLAEDLVSIRRQRQEAERCGADTEKKEDRSLPSSFYLLIETGRRPGPDLFLSDYLSMLYELLSDCESSDCESFSDANSIS